jgi:hypothetical protein
VGPLTIHSAGWGILFNLGPGAAIGNTIFCNPNDTKTKHKRNTPERQPNEIRLTLFVAVGNPVPGNGASDDDKAPVEHWRLTWEWRAD